MQRKQLNPVEAEKHFQLFNKTLGIVSVRFGVFISTFTFLDGTEIVVSAKSKNGDLEYFLIVRKED